FRTWAGTVLAARELLACPPCTCPTQARHNVVAAVAGVARRLGNTPAVCRKCYVHPAVLAAYLDGSLAQALGPAGAASPGSDGTGREAGEAALLAFLEGRPTPAALPA